MEIYGPNLDAELNILEKEIGDTRINKFVQEMDNDQWEGQIDITEHAFFEVWRNMKKRNRTETQSGPIIFDQFLPVITEDDLLVLPNDSVQEMEVLTSEEIEVITSEEIEVTTSEEIEVFTTEDTSNGAREENITSTNYNVATEERSTSTNNNNIEENNTTIEENNTIREENNTTREENNTTREENYTREENNNTREEIQQPAQQPKTHAHSKSENNDLPSPFKSLFPCPEELQPKKKRKQKERIPPVVTSDAYQLYHKRKNEKKTEQEKLKKERMEKRKEKAQLKLSEKKKKVKVVKEHLEDSCSDPDDPEEEETQNSSNIKENKYVIVDYEEEFFPGVVTKVTDKGAKVKVMSMVGNNWRWPDIDDVLFYPFEDIKCRIKDPQLLNSRGIYHVPEIFKFRK